MEHHQPRDPRLASILQNLSHLTNTHKPTENLDDTILPSRYSTQTPPRDELVAPSIRHPPRHAAPPKPDPTTITEWPSAVKFVMNHVSHNAETSIRIKRLIKNQHDNERQWFAGREALIEKHKGRVESKKKMEDIMKSLGRAASSSEFESPAWSPEQERDELDRYEKKVYGALGQMVAAMDKELTTLKVPFFAIQHGLVHDGPVEKAGTVSRKVLVELQKKMLQLLQDLFDD